MNPIVIGNIIPMREGLEDVEVDCVVCQRRMMTDSAGGNFFSSDNPAWICDDCGRQAAPELWPLLLKLRAGDGIFSDTIGGARIDQDDVVWNCCVCGRDLDEPRGWHPVNRLNGRPVCLECAVSQCPQLIGLADSLNAIEKRVEHHEPRSLM